LRQALGEFIELVVHNYPYVWVGCFLSDFWLHRENVTGDPGFQAAVGAVTVLVNREWTPMHANGAVGNTSWN